MQWALSPLPVKQRWNRHRDSHGRFAPVGKEHNLIHDTSFWWQNAAASGSLGDVLMRDNVRSLRLRESFYVQNLMSRRGRQTQLEGLRHGGVMGSSRRHATDFGSGWQGLKGLQNWARHNVLGRSSAVLKEFTSGPLVSELPQDAELFFHGTSSRSLFTRFATEHVYLAESVPIATLYAFNPKGKGPARVLPVAVRKGRVKHDLEIVKMQLSRSLVGEIERRATQAKHEGYDYFDFMHPTPEMFGKPAVDPYRVRVALQPEKLSIIGQEPSQEERWQHLAGAAWRHPAVAIVPAAAVYVKDRRDPEKSTGRTLFDTALTYSIVSVVQTQAKKRIGMQHGISTALRAEEVAQAIRQAAASRETATMAHNSLHSERGSRRMPRAV